MEAPVTITFHEDYRYPFQTWVVGTRVDGEQRYAVMTCMPVRAPRSGDPSDWREYEAAARDASDGLTALLMADTPEVRAKLFDSEDRRYLSSFEIGQFGSTPAAIRWPELLATVERVRGSGGANGE